MKSLALQFAKYFGVAAVGYIFDFGLMITCKEVFHIHYLLSATVGFVVGLVVVYALSSKYVFGKSKLASRNQEFLIFTLIGLVGLGILNLAMWGMTNGLHVNYILSKILATIGVYAWNFLARRRLYHDRESPSLAS